MFCFLFGYLFLPANLSASRLVLKWLYLASICMALCPVMARISITSKSVFSKKRLVASWRRSWNRKSLIPALRAAMSILRVMLALSIPNTVHVLFIAIGHEMDDTSPLPAPQ